MRTRLCLTTALIGTLALTTGAVPALTADNGSIVGTVSVQAAAPCIELSTTTLDFGTAPFAPQGSASFATSGDFSVANCSTAASTFSIVGTDATAAGGATWSLTDNWQNCDGNLNRYGLFWAERPENFSGLFIVKTPQTLLHRRPPANDPASTFNPGESETLVTQALMPCVGSDGAGQTFSFSIGLTATVA